MGSMKEFLEWNEDMRIDDIPLIGRRFTWARGKSRSRLDRFFMDQDWGFRFPEATLTALPNSISDHTPILLSLDKQVRESRPFRNLDTWFSHPGFLKMVKEQWKKLGNMPPTKKLKALHQPIRKWNKDCFGNIDSNINKLEEEQVRTHRKIEAGDNDECDFARLAALETQLNKWLDRKASYWQQLSREKWIKSGDRNTKYYHVVALGKRRFKRINQIKSGNRTHKKPRTINIEILSFYKKLYRQELKPKIHLDSSILPKISEEQLQSLEKRPSMEEISLALHDCDGSKAPGYDGFNLKFVKSIWKDIEHEVYNFILDFWILGSSLR